MKESGTCKIESTIAALKQTIENRKIQIERAKIQSASHSSNVVPHLFSEVINRAGGMYGPISQALENGGGFVQNFIKKAQQSVEENPWGALRKVAVSSFGIGLFLSRRHHKAPMGEKE